jgi:hypothetical protein
LRQLIAFLAGAALTASLLSAQPVAAHNGDQLHGVLSCLANPGQYAQAHCDGHWHEWKAQVTFRN